MNNTNMDKSSLRHRLLEQREKLTPDEVKILSTKICRQIQKLPEWQTASTIAVYYPQRKEVNLLSLAETSLSLQKKVLLPQVDPQSKTIHFRSITHLKHDVQEGFAGINEPKGDCPIVTPEKIDLIVVPGVGFDSHGNRLGRGKGYYDRFLADFKGTTIGVGYDIQMVEQLPAEPHDEKVQYCITEHKTINTKNMPAILNGKKVSRQLLQSLQQRVERLQKHHTNPRLVFFLIGNNPSSRVYVNMKKKTSQSIGMLSEIIQYPETVSQRELLHRIEELNQDQNTHGIMVQLPLPPHLSVREITNAIHPCKDVDGLHAQNQGNLSYALETEHRPAATALGIIRLLEHYRIDPAGKHAVVLGRSLIIGKPIAAMLTNRNATVTLCHTKTNNISEHCARADLIISATGVPGIVQLGWVKKGAIVIDAGYALVNGKAVGDVEFTSVAPKCSYITPVPGGCGPMTIYAILENTVKAAEEQASQNIESKHL